MKKMIDEEDDWILKTKINQSSIKEPQAIARFAESSANDKHTGSGKKIISPKKAVELSL